MKRSVFSICLMVGALILSSVTCITAMAEEQGAKKKVQPEVDAGRVDLSADTRRPYYGSDNVVNKMGHLPDLVDQEKFLSDIGFDGDWPTPDEVYKKVEEIKTAGTKDEKQSGAVKMRGPANFDPEKLDKDAKKYQTAYEVWSDVPADFGNQRTTIRHTASHESHCLSCGTRYTDKPYADPAEDQQQQQRSVDDQ